jgi:hypothetical protein
MYDLLLMCTIWPLRGPRKDSKGCWRVTENLRAAVTSEWNTESSLSEQISNLMLYVFSANAFYI